MKFPTRQECLNALLAWAPALNFYGYGQPTRHIQRQLSDNVSPRASHASCTFFSKAQREALLPENNSTEGRKAHFLGVPCS